MDIVIDTKDYKDLLESIRFVYGYDFTDYAESAIKRRITHFMKAKNIETLDILGKQLLKDEKYFQEFVLEMSVTVTEMFRDPTFYKALRDKVVKRLATYPLIRIWIAGCATGEEVYSVAILLKEEGLLNRSIIYATDINQKSLEIAKQGTYSWENLNAYRKNYIDAGGSADLSDYYSDTNGTIIFDKSLSQHVLFSPHNLAADKSFNEFQLIICRNVIMYFNRHLQDKVVDLFYDSLCPFGFLGLGDKESLLFSEKRRCFDDSDRKEKIFIKTR